MENFLNNAAGQTQPELNINPRDLPWAGCEKGAQIYESAVVFKRLSPIISPTGKEEYLPAEVFICKGCGKVPRFIYDRIPDLPEEMRSTCGAQK